MDNILKDSDVDFLFVVIGREEVETGDCSQALKTLNTLTADRETALKFMNRVSLSVHGYDGDPRELFEIAEVRALLQKLDQEFPFWFFFLSTNTNSLTLFALSLCRITRVSRTSSAYNQKDFAQFIEFHLGAMNHVFDSFGLPEELNEQRSDELAQYFLRSQIQN